MRQEVEKEIVMVGVSQKKVSLIVGWPNKDGRRRLGTKADHDTARRVHATSQVYLRPTTGRQFTLQQDPSKS